MSSSSRPFLHEIGCPPCGRRHVTPTVLAYRKSVDVGLAVLQEEIVAGRGDQRTTDRHYLTAPTRIRPRR